MVCKVCRSPRRYSHHCEVCGSMTKPRVKRKRDRLPAKVDREFNAASDKRAFRHESRWVSNG